MKMGVEEDLLNLFHIPMFDESLRRAEGLFRRRGRASEGRERGGVVTKGGGNKKAMSQRGRKNVSSYLITPEMFGITEEAARA